MDRSDWNETPRGRSPGLIASHDAWLKRTTPVAKPSEPAKAPVSAPVQLTDPWSASLNGLVASNDVVTPTPVASSAFGAGSHPSFVVRGPTSSCCASARLQELYVLRHRQRGFGSRPADASTDPSDCSQHLKFVLIVRDAARKSH
ncbi:MAG: hypothetical protein CBARDMAM_3445 [uncultured Caballeronia sp.]|nr:MAG: hypothetical protein CBARDMAM_3445 [uncultured Caballeronia sp.]